MLDSKGERMKLLETKVVLEDILAAAHRNSDVYFSKERKEAIKRALIEYKMNKETETVINKMFRDEHLKELEKYSLGELIEAIESRDGISRYDVGRHEVASLNIKKKDAIMGGYCVLFRLNETSIPTEELSSIIYTNPDNLSIRS